MPSRRRLRRDKCSQRHLRAKENLGASTYDVYTVEGGRVQNSQICEKAARKFCGLRGSVSEKIQIKTFCGHVTYISRCVACSSLPESFSNSSPPLFPSVPLWWLSPGYLATRVFASHAISQCCQFLQRSVWLWFLPAVEKG